jgi:dihydroorotate dehydrogenase (fumarate)
VLCKSATLEKRDGNPLPRYVELPNPGGGGGTSCPTSINSEGLPNAGIDYYLAPELIQTVVGRHAKPYIVSISGLKLEDNLRMVRQAAATPDVAAIELNLACPNVPGKPVVAYDFDQMEDIIRQVFELDLRGKPLGVKLAPYFDMPHFGRAAQILNDSPVGFVVCTNTIGNALMVDTELEMALIAPNGGFGGLAGGHIKYTALANVRKFYELLRKDIHIVGVGGVSTGKDAFDLILCGASAVHYTEGPKCFDRIAGELEDLMRAKGYASIMDFRGRLLPYSRDLVKQQESRGARHRRARGSAAAAGLTGVSDVHAAVLRAIIFAQLALIAVLVYKLYYYAARGVTGGGGGEAEL